jgi:hypothetical protein
MYVKWAMALGLVYRSEWLAAKSLQTITFFGVLRTSLLSQNFRCFFCTEQYIK